MHSSEKGSTFEKSSRVFFFESKELSSCLSEFGESEMYSPYFFLILESVLSDKLKLVIYSLLFERSSGSFESR
jgi:hypothetical protein